MSVNIYMKIPGLLATVPLELPDGTTALHLLISEEGLEELKHILSSSPGDLVAWRGDQDFDISCPDSFKSPDRKYPLHVFLGHEEQEMIRVVPVGSREIKGIEK